MKILALDLGDVHTGIALSDELHIIASPYTTVKTHELISFLQELFAKERISTTVVGYPKTLRGTESAQTQKVVSFKEELQQLFPTITWVLWDERLTSKQAQRIKPAKTKEEKNRSHAIAASLILEGYLDYLRF